MRAGTSGPATTATTATRTHIATASSLDRSGGRGRQGPLERAEIALHLDALDCVLDFVLTCPLALDRALVLALILKSAITNVIGWGR